MWQAALHLAVPNGAALIIAAKRASCGTLRVANRAPRAIARQPGRGIFRSRRRSPHRKPRDATRHSRSARL